MISEAKQKARELVLNYLKVGSTSREGWFNTSLAKKCALISVQSTIEEINTLPTDGCKVNYQDVIDFYKKIKVEIEKL